MRKRKLRSRLTYGLLISDYCGICHADLLMMDGIRYIISLLLYYESRIPISFIPSLSNPPS
jgi:hypothetical protein